MSTGRAAPPVPEPAGWGWRQRVRDPRAVGLLGAVACDLAGGAVLLRNTRWVDPGGFVFAFVVLSVLIAFTLPPWRGTRSSPRGGAIVAFLGGLFFLAVTVVLAFGFGVSLSI